MPLCPENAPTPLRLRRRLADALARGNFMDFDRGLRKHIVSRICDSIFALAKRFRTARSMEILLTDALVRLVRLLLYLLLVAPDSIILPGL